MKGRAFGTLLSIGSALLAIGMACRAPKDIANAKDANLTALSICDVASTSSPLDGRTIRVAGNLNGFHQLIIESEECPNNILLTDLSYTDFAVYFAENAEDSRKPNSISGRILAEGKLKLNGGYLKDHGQLVIDTKTNKVLNHPTDVIVNKLEETRIISFTANSR